MMEAVKRDEIDVLLFCHLDRWFRSVADYYKFIEILEAHNYNWVTSDEEQLFANLTKEIRQCKLNWEVKAAKKKRVMSSTDKAAMKHKLQKLKELYVNDFIDLEE